MLTETPTRWIGRNFEATLALLLTMLAFAVRVNQVDFNSLSEDETAKWAAVQEYRQGHFVGVNSEHPMLLKVMAWASITAGEHWSHVALRHGWPSMRFEGWIRLPNVIFGAATAGILFLLCCRMMGLVGSFAAGFFWSVAPLAVALNRLAKEETLLTFFTVLACYFYCRAQQADAEQSSRQWYDLSAISFGLAFASQYIPHLVGLNALAWLAAGKMGLTRNPSRFSYRRFFFVLVLTFILVNPVVLFPSNFNSILHWLHHDGVKHSGYDFDGTLYMNFPSRFLAGVPWKFYLWLVMVKTPIPILVAIVIGSILLLRNRRSLAACFFLTLGMVQLTGLSLSGAKWIRYSLPMLPFFYVAGGYAVQQTWMVMKKRAVSHAVIGATAVVLLGWPLLELHSWGPYYSFYLNPLGGGTKNITRYFAPDEVSEFDTREVAQQLCPFAPASTRVATARPMSLGYYLEACGRTDLQIVPLYDAHYSPHDGDLVILEPSRRFFETQRYFDTLKDSGMSHSDVRVGPVFASSIYVFDPSAPEPDSTQKHETVTRLRAAPPRTGTDIQELGTRNTTSTAFAEFFGRRIR